MVAHGQPAGGRSWASVAAGGKAKGSWSYWVCSSVLCREWNWCSHWKCRSCGRVAPPWVKAAQPPAAATGQEQPAADAEGFVVQPRGGKARRQAKRTAARAASAGAASLAGVSEASSVQRSAVEWHRQEVKRIEDFLAAPGESIDEACLQSLRSALDRERRRLAAAEAALAERRKADTPLPKALHGAGNALAKLVRQGRAKGQALLKAEEAHAAAIGEREAAIAREAACAEAVEECRAALEAHREEQRAAEARQAKEVGAAFVGTDLLGMVFGLIQQVEALPQGFFAGNGEAAFAEVAKQIAADLDGDKGDGVCASSGPPLQDAAERGQAARRGEARGAWPSAQPLARDLANAGAALLDDQPLAADERVAETLDGRSQAKVPSDQQMRMTAQEACIGKACLGPQPAPESDPRDSESRVCERAGWIHNCVAGFAMAAPHFEASLLMDIRKLFEHVRRDFLWPSAQRVGFYLKLLRGLLAIFQAPGIVLAGGMASAPLGASGAVLAGCALPDDGRALDMLILGPRGLGLLAAAGARRASDRAEMARLGHGAAPAMPLFWDALGQVFGLRGQFSGREKAAWRSDAMAVMWVNRPAVGLLGGRLYPDGSTLDPEFGCFRRAGWGIVQCDEFGNLQAAVHGSVRLDLCPFQTAKDGGDLAVWMQSRYFGPSFIEFFDCESTVSCFKLGRRYATAAYKPIARTSEGQWLGCAHADRLAKAGAALHSASASARSEFFGAKEVVRGLSMWIAQVSIAWQGRAPKDCEGLPVCVVRWTAASVAVPLGERVDGLGAAPVCVSDAAPAAVEARGEQSGSRPAAAGAWASAARDGGVALGALVFAVAGRALAFARCGEGGDEQEIMACTKCGAYARLGGRPGPQPKLRERCPGATGLPRSLRDQKSRWERGLHPGGTPLARDTRRKGAETPRLRNEAEVPQDARVRFLKWLGVQPDAPAGVASSASAAGAAGSGAGGAASSSAEVPAAAGGTAEGVGSRKAWLDARGFDEESLLSWSEEAEEARLECQSRKRRRDDGDGGD
ncbi:unnamed protein product [Prorocentrum cordatum]|uniref:RanBP2-type domain-containing protein n=1 Tax=Prorocentrum cordatum TaxID=2364126 RepID=A0ABN9R3U9_9DINO|nr:unnamed protein product [Polarella glacialis]